MITLLASIAGFISSIFPELIKLQRDKYDEEHELAILNRQIEISKTKANDRLEEIYLAKDLMETSSIYSTYKSGINWVDTLNATVRHVLAYSFFALYCLIKCIQFNSIDISQTYLLSEIIWNIDDQAIFAGIISFYFGQRTFNKMNRRI